MEIEWIVNNTKPPKNEAFYSFTIPVIVKLKNGRIPQNFYIYDSEYMYDSDFDMWMGRWVCNAGGEEYAEWFTDSEVVAWAIVK